VSAAPAPGGVSAELLEGGGVLRVVFSRAKGNVLTMDLMRALGATLGAHRDDRHLKLVALRGAGGTFSYGASVEEHRQALAPAMLETFHALARLIARYPVPVVALVEGRCLGGAFELALCCHFVFAVRGAVFACPEIRLGVFPPVLAAIGPHRLGAALAERLLLTGEEMDAQALAPGGFVTALVGEGEDPEAALLPWYRDRLQGLSAFALRQATRAARAGSGLEAALDEGLAALECRYREQVLASHDGNEGVEAFLARRPPVWEDA
jgi:cyclohexa-1,5-dienecarbonyl-CoA hydratase